MLAMTQPMWLYVGMIVIWGNKYELLIHISKLYEKTGRVQLTERGQNHSWMLHVSHA